MRTLFWQINITLDGFMEGSDGELDDTAEFHDEDFESYASDMLQSIGGILLGRVTYELFAGYWPTATGPDADRMNELPKHVFSTTLQKVEWRNSSLVSGDVAEEVSRLKRQPGKDIALFGSANLASTLIDMGLIDEYRVFVSPVVLGQGTSSFEDVRQRVPLDLTHAATWSSGIVALHYRPKA